MRVKTLVYLLLIIIVLSRPDSAFQYAYDGLCQWAVKMVPTLFPFMMISSIMIYSGADIELGKLISCALKRVYRYSEYGLYAIFIGFFCGFPMGAKVVSELYENGKISKSEAQSLLGFCNNIGPAYFLGIILPVLKACGYDRIYLFIFGMYGIPALYGIILSRIYSGSPDAARTERRTDDNKPSMALPAILKKACFENTQSLILLGGYITFTNSFRILLDFIPFSSDIRSVISSFIEIIGGVQSIYLSSMTNSVKIFWIMTALCFGGVSCILQAGAFLEKSKFSFAVYLKDKLVLTAISAVYYAVVISLA